MKNAKLNVIHLCAAQSSYGDLLNQYFYCLYQCSTLLLSGDTLRITIFFSYTLCDLALKKLFLNYLDTTRFEPANVLPYSLIDNTLSVVLRVVKCNGKFYHVALLTRSLAGRL